MNTAWEMPAVPVQLSGVFCGGQNHKLKTMANILGPGSTTPSDEDGPRDREYSNLLDDLKARGIQTLGAARRFCRHRYYATRSEAAA